eukprot:14392880-Alexandrium_andersonii.AAC.1
MCIRDRQTAANRCNRLQCLLRACRSPLTSGSPRRDTTGAPNTPRAPSGGPVSYTHLTLPTICSV